jgi:hypothetical protein
VPPPPGSQVYGAPAALEVGSEARVAIGQPPPVVVAPPKTVKKSKKNIALKVRWLAVGYLDCALSTVALPMRATS